LSICAKLNAEGILATVDYLGENISSIEEAAATRDAYLTVLAEIARRGLKATISIKLTHFGIDFSEDACREYVADVMAAAHKTGNSVEFDMEALTHVDRTLQMVMDQHAAHGSVRAVIQAYLRRSENDIRKLSDVGIPVRLCKGAYSEPPEVAFPHKSEVNANFLRLAKILLKEGVCQAMATHDERIIREVVRIVRQHEADPGCLEFQMLYGIRKSLQRELAKDGFQMRLYVPYGVAWYPYFMRRLAERPLNLLFIFKNLLRR